MDRKGVLATWALLTTLLLGCITVEVNPPPETAVRTVAAVASPTPNTGISAAPTATPALIPMPVPTVPNWPVVLADDFDDPESGFANTSGDESWLSYEDGQYTIGIVPEYWVVWSSRSDGVPSDFVMDVSVSADAAAGFAGLIFRKQGDSPFYVFAIAPDGQYSLMTSGPVSEVILDWQDSAHVRQGTDTNRLRVVSAGGSVSLYVNGEYLHTVTDVPFTSGEVGLIAGTRQGETHALFHFDNLMVYAPTPVTPPPPPVATSAPTSTATQPPTPTATLRPTQTTPTRGPTEFDPIIFAEGLTEQSDPIMPSMTFPAGTTEVYAVWACRGMYQGLEMVSIWYHDGQEYARSTQQWEKTSERGRWWLRIYRASGQSLPSGNYRVELYVGGRLLQSGTCTIQ